MNNNNTFNEMIKDWDRADLIIKPRDYYDKLTDFYNNGIKRGKSTGWNVLDDHYLVSKNRLNVVTGIPSHGKSEFIDALSVNLALNHNWKFAFFSPENFPIEYHLQKLTEKYVGKPFFGEYRMTPEERIEAAIWIDNHFCFILPNDGWTPRNLLEYAETAKDHFKIDGLILDPWNEMEHKRPKNMSETEYISDTLTIMRNFARKHHIVIWIIVHPLKLRKDEQGKYPVPTPYDIAGSAHWYNKADNCLAVWRDLDSGQVKIYIQKIRFKHDGKQGAIDMKYNKLNGRYSDVWEV